MPQAAKIVKNRLIIFLTMISLLFLPACEKKDEPKTVRSFLLDTVVSVTYYAEADRAAAEEALDLCRRMESVFSRTQPGSELYRLNESGSMTVSDELLAAVTLALDFSRATGGRFDPTMGAVSALYAFSSDSPACPDAGALKEALSHTGWQKVRIDGNLITLEDPAAELDLGAVAKGFIADRMKALLQERGVASAIINLGGNILCLGARPDGAAYRVGVQYPDRDSSEIVETVSAADLSIVTSGVYQRFFEQDGRLYHHILDPETGDSLRNGLSAVTVIGPSGAMCDALSTSCFSLGLEDGMALVNAEEGYYALFIEEDLTIHYSDGFREALLT